MERALNGAPPSWSEPSMARYPHGASPQWRATLMDPSIPPSAGRALTNELAGTRFRFMMMACFTSGRHCTRASSGSCVAPGGGGGDSAWITAPEPAPGPAVFQRQRAVFQRQRIGSLYMREGRRIILPPPLCSDEPPVNSLPHILVHNLLMAAEAATLVHRLVTHNHGARFTLSTPTPSRPGSHLP